MKRHYYTDEELQIIRDRYPHEKTESIATDLGLTVSSVYQKASALGLKKSPDYLAGPHACRLRRDDNVGAKFRFKKGQIPWNKGINFISGGRSVETQFKLGIKPWTRKPIGTERISKDGYLQRKVTDTGKPPRDWVGVHILIWTEHNGPVPDGHAVIFRDGNKTNFEPSNLECISRQELMKRNSVHNYPPEIARTIQLIGALNRKINSRSKKDGQPKND